MNYKRPDNKIQAKIFDLISHWSFETFIMICIILNVVVMAMSYEGSTNEYNSALENINLGFTSVFIFETIIKIISKGVKGIIVFQFFDCFLGFWASGWNRFDFFVVISSILDLILNSMGGTSNNFLRVGP
jgi:hypothetical protein